MPFAHGPHGLDLTAGARFDREHKEGNLSSFFAPAIAAPTLVVAEDTFSQVSPQVSAAFRIRPGHTLSEHDVEEIQSLLARRDKQIKFLYDREKEFHASIERSVSYRLGLLLTWPLRRLRRAIKKSAP